MEYRPQALQPALPLPGTAHRPAAPCVFARADRVFALVFLALGELFWELQAWSKYRWFKDTGFGTVLFCALYTGAVLAYARRAKCAVPRVSWFWFAVLWALGGSYALPYGGGLLGPVQYAALLCTAAYWTLCVTGRLLREGKTSNWLPLDLLNALFVVPLGNFGRLPAALASGVRCAAARPRPAGSRRARAAGVAGGIAAAALCLCLALPLLMAADEGFAALLRGWTQHFAALLRGWDTFWREAGWRLAFGLPTALYLYGLVYGSVQNRRTCVYAKKEVCAAQRALRFAPRSTVGIALAALCAVYVLFVAMQAGYLFGAFFGRLPEGFSYAQYARRGFFELCRTAVLNLCILLAANTMSRAQLENNRALRACNAALSVLTLLLIATAASKMALYISVYGLTVLRVLTSVFLLWLALVFVLVLVRQARPVPIVRAAAVAGAVLFCLLCALPVQRAIDAGNALRAPAAAAQESAEAFPRT